jgi:uncharacterized protein YbaP (TraB family)
MVCQDEFSIPENLKSAINNTDQLVIEANIQDPTLFQKIAKVMAMPIPLSQQISPADYHIADSVLQALCNVPLQAFENVQPVAILSLLAQKAFTCEKPASYETALIELSKTQHKSLDYLEELEAQMEYLIKSYTHAQIIEQVKLGKEGLGDIVKVQALYKEQDIAGMYDFMATHDFTDENTLHWMLEVRNTNWVNKMPEMMKNKSSVFAVGSAHLGGEIGIIQKLRSKGYKVTPVLN